MKNILSFLFLFLIALPATGHAEQSFEEKAIGALLLYCLPTLTIGDSVQRVAEMQKLPELPPEAQKAFLHGKPGKVYALPNVGTDAVLSAPDVPICSVLIRKLDPVEFIKQADHWFASPPSPFKLLKNDVSEDETQRRYEAYVKDATLHLLITVRNKPVMGGVQAVITLGRAGH